MGVELEWIGYAEGIRMIRFQKEMDSVLACCSLTITQAVLAKVAFPLVQALF